MMQIGHDQNGSDDILVPPPRGSDIDDCFVPPRQPIVQDALDHEERNEHEQNESAHTKELEHCAVPAAETGLRFGERRRRVGHGVRLLK
jgi:hypothetical protein